MFEAVLIIIILTLGLCRTVKFTKARVALAIFSFGFKLYGLCVIYYFALEVASEKDICKHGKVFSTAKLRPTPVPSSGVEIESQCQNNGNGQQRLNNDYVYSECGDLESDNYDDKCPLNNIEESRVPKSKVNLSGSEVQYAVIYM